MCHRKDGRRGTVERHMSSMPSTQAIHVMAFGIVQEAEEDLEWGTNRYHACVVPEMNSYGGTTRLAATDRQFLLLLRSTCLASRALSGTDFNDGDAGRVSRTSGLSEH